MTFNELIGLIFVSTFLVLAFRLLITGVLSIVDRMKQRKNNNDRY